jgi:Skp family chaperone for outer membrane proteins
MRITRLVLWSVGLCLVAAAAWGIARAQGEPPKAPAAAQAAKLATCDVRDIFRNYLRAKDLLTQRDKRLREIQDEREKRQRVIDGIKLRLEGLKKDSPQYEKDLNEMQRLTIDLSSWMQFQEQLIFREHFRMTKDMYTEVLRAVEKVAKDRGAQIVLDRQRQDVDAESNEDLLRQMETRKVLYGDDAIDLTEAVLSRLNEAYRAARPPAGQ